MHFPWFALIALFTPALGALTPELIALAQKYAPQFRLAAGEKYFPSSVEYMLQHYTVYGDKGKPLPKQPHPLTPGYLDKLANKGDNTYLTVPDIRANYLRGVDPSKQKVPVYTFVVTKEGGIVDLYYWTFYPFNLGKNINGIGEIGDHIGDWERMAVRTLDGKAIEADYHAHNDGDGVGTKCWKDVPKTREPGDSEERPAGYVAYGSHGIWPQAKTWVYLRIGNLNLTDETNDGGVIWNSKDNIYPIEYLPSAKYSGKDAWLNYMGFWGNKDNCALPPLCSLEHGPPGPYPQTQNAVNNKTYFGKCGKLSKYSDMLGPFSQTLAPLAVNSSTSFYKFRLDLSVLQLIQLRSFAYLTVEQICLGRQSSSNEDIATSTYGTIELKMSDDRVYEVVVPRCTSEASHVDSYTVGLCTTQKASDCVWAQQRKLRTYLPEKEGVTNGPAIMLNMDHDNWKWN